MSQADDSGSDLEESEPTEQVDAEGAGASEPGAPADGGPAPPKRNVTVVRLPPDQERVVHIIGTAHVSKKSVEEVREVIAELKPDTVCVELDKMRYEALTDDTRWRKLDIFQVIKQRKMLFLMASLALQAYQKRLGEQLGVRPGAELLAGVEAAKEVGAEVVLADRDVQATLRRTWANLGFFAKLKLLTALVASIFDGEEVDEERVEELKDSEHIGDLMSEFAKALPQVKEPLIDERDDYLMSTIEEAPGKTLVAVVGAAHVAGMVQSVGKTVDREALRQVPPPSLFVRSLKWVIPIVILAAFGWGYYEHRTEGLLEMAKAWVIPNAIAAGLFTLVAGGKLISVLTAIIASPITSLNPTIGAGMVVGLVEAWLRKPTVEDCEKLGKEVTTFKGMYRNPFSRVLIVAVAATIGSALGAYIAAPWVLALL
ncbi:MAG: TraB/GumN family protein [Deltaproteobacteria bacterium]|nr:TraB/GumN family protein [Deltaproteobacteria bacterium]